MYKITQVKARDRKGYRELYAYMKELCVLYTSVKNTVTFHIRQHMTGLQKEEWFLSYGVAEGVLRLSGNESYRALPAQVNQNAVRDAENDWCSYFKFLKAFGRNLGAFLGKPEMPKYKRGMSTVTLTNQTCKLVGTEKSGIRKDTVSLRFPKTDCKLYMGRYFNGDTALKEVTIKP